MSIYVRPFKVADVKAFEPMEKIEDDKLTKNSELLEAIEKSGLAVTGVRNGVIFGCGGVHPINEEHGELWFRLSTDCLNHRLDTLRWIKDGLKIIEETYPFKQLNAAVLCGYKNGIKLVEWCGFKRTQVKDGKWFIYSKRVK